jgi:hypothetical protein
VYGYDALRFHLSGQLETQFSGWRYVSGMTAVLRDARRDSGRSQDTGRVVCESDTGHWLGAVGYLVLLDQIGKCFRDDDTVAASNPPWKAAVQRCLVHWAPEVPAAQVHALYALRNALAHDYSLFNSSRDPNLRHHFTLHRSATGPIVQLPQVPWDGKFDTPPSRQSATWVSLRLLGELAEEIVERVRSSFADGRLSVLLGGGTDELVNRYGLLVPDPNAVGPSLSTATYRGT